MSASSCSVGMAPASEFGVALTMTMTRMGCSFDWGWVALRKGRRTRRPGIDMPPEKMFGTKKTTVAQGHRRSGLRLALADYSVGGAPAASAAAVLASAGMAAVDA